MMMILIIGMILIVFLTQNAGHPFSFDISLNDDSSATNSPVKISYSKEGSKSKLVYVDGDAKPETIEHQSAAKELSDFERQFNEIDVSSTQKAPDE